MLKKSEVFIEENRRLLRKHHVDLQREAEDGKEIHMKHRGRFLERTC
jgi:hypothetical protein